MRVESIFILFLLTVPIKGRRVKTYLSELDYCKRFVAGSSLVDLEMTPLFIVDNLMEESTNCSDYLPSNPNDVIIADPSRTVLDYCKNGFAQVRLCFMEPQYRRSLVRVQNLRLSEIQNLDLAQANFNEVQFKGTCWVCVNQARKTIEFS